ncbi:ABC transporter permease [Georgenia sp. Z1344]|uniref:ABC transporter permease n=1 Tax=Georgenia sp. Z1344 TaxID=3416706 RepID=UPI003CF0D6FC
MSPVRLLLRRQLRRHRRQTVALALLAVLAGLLGTVAAVMTLDYPGLVESRTEALDGADVVSVVPAGEATDVAVAAATGSAGVEAHSVEPVLTAPAEYAYGDTTQTGDLLVVDLDADRPFDEIRAIDNDHPPVDNPVHLPLIFSTGGGYEPGDPFVVTVGAREVTFHVQGFVETVTLGVPTMGFPLVALDSETFAATAEDLGDAFVPASLLRAQTTDADAANDVARAVTDSLTSAGLVSATDNTWSYTMTLETIASTIVIGSSIYAAMLGAFAVVVTVVAAVVVRFLVANLVREDVRAIGAMRAVGFSAGQVTASIVLLVAIPVVLAACVGVVLSPLVLPLLESSMAAQTGLPWEAGISWPGAFVVVGVLGAVAAGTAALAARRLRRIPPVVALRGGQPAHVPGRDRLPLASTRGPLNLVLGLKRLVSAPGQAVALGVVLAIVAFTGSTWAAIAGTLGRSEQDFVQLLVGDLEDVLVVVGADTDRTEALETVRAVDGVEDAFYRQLVGLTVDGLPLRIQVAADQGHPERSSLAAGRHPVHPNEIMLGVTAADRLEAEVGDQVPVTVQGAEADYLVVGIVQTTQQAGMTGGMTEAAWHRLEPDGELTSMAVYASAGDSPADVAAGVRPALGDDLVSSYDLRTTIGGQVSVYSTMISGLTVALAALGVVIVTLVVGLLVTTMVVREHRSFGIRKALGFTSRDLVRQVLATILPVVALAAAIGAGAAGFAAEPVAGSMLAGVGHSSIELDAPPWLPLAIVAGLVALAWVCTALAASRLRRISPYGLLTE